MHAGNDLRKEILNSVKQNAKRITIVHRFT